MEPWIKQSLCLFGQGLKLLAYQDDMIGKNNDIKTIIKFQMKKVLCINVAVRIITMSDDIPIQTLNMSINSLVSLLKKNKQVIIQKLNEIPLRLLR